MNEDIARTIDAALATGLDWIRGGGAFNLAGISRDASAHELAEARAALRAAVASAFPTTAATNAAPEPAAAVQPAPEAHDEPAEHASV